MSKASKFIGRILLRRGDRPRVIGVSWYARLLRVRKRFHSQCLAKGGAKLQEAHGCKGPPQPIYKDSLEAQSERCAECGNLIQSTLVASGGGDGLVKPTPPKIILP
jgi:hypothetical protein